MAAPFKKGEAPDASQLAYLAQVTFEPDIYNAAVASALEGGWKTIAAGPCVEPFYLNAGLIFAAKAAVGHESGRYPDRSFRHG